MTRSSLINFRGNGFKNISAPVNIYCRWPFPDVILQNIKQDMATMDSGMCVLFST
jgi:hypothetical protein